MTVTKLQSSSIWTIIKMLVLAVSCRLIVWSILALLGYVPPLHAGRPNLGDDVLLWLLPEHALIGIVLFLSILTSGAALLYLCPTSWKLTSLDVAMLALPLGAIYWLSACTVVRMCGFQDWAALVIGYGLPILKLPQLRNWARELKGNADSSGKSLAVKAGYLVPKDFIQIYSDRDYAIYLMPSSGQH